MQNQDGSYDFIEAQALEKRYAAHDGKNLPIRPFELKTYLKVGQWSAALHNMCPPFFRVANSRLHVCSCST